MAEPTLLAIDCGTQSVRALLFDLTGRLQARAQVPITSYRSEQPGWLENDPQAFWASLCAACQGLWEQPGVERNAIAGLVLTTQRGTTLALDEARRPLRPAIVWPDQRRAARARPLAWWWELALRGIGMRETVRYFQHEAEASWIAEQQPELWARTRHFLLLSGYLNLRLTGRLADSVGSQVGYLPLDYRRGRWAGAADWKWQALPIRRDMLPELVAPGQPLGAITAEAARDTGLPLGLPVLAGAADKACEALGAGCVSPRLACLSMGTAATVSLTTPRYVEPVAFVPPYPAALPGHYSAEIQISRGFWMVSWFKEQFGQAEQEEARALGLAPEALFDRLVAAVPPGAQGLLLQPFWGPGIKRPGPQAKGAVIGFGEVHTRAHLYRAIIEGLAYGLREGAERLERRVGGRIEALRVAGGGSQSDAAMQITADVFNRPAERPHLADASGLGAAIIGAVGLGLQPDFDTAVARMTRPGQRFEPRSGPVATYEQLYQRVYRRLYQRLEPLYQDIADITGYRPAPGAPLPVAAADGQPPSPPTA